MRQRVSPPNRPDDLHRSCYTHSLWYLSCDEYDQLRNDHQHRCALCGKPDRYLNVDHDHRIGDSAIRGLLCPACNAGHMRRIDEGYRPIDSTTRDYLMNPWYLVRKGTTLGYDPVVHVRLADLPHADLARLRGALSYNWPGPLTAEHPGLAACLAANDLRPFLRLGWMREWQTPTVDIADPAGPTSRASALGRSRSGPPIGTNAQAVRT